MYGQSFTLASAKNNTLNSRAYGGGEAGESTRARGFLGYYEVNEKNKTLKNCKHFDIYCFIELTLFLDL